MKRSAADIPLLIQHFLKKYRQEYERPDLEFSEEALQILLHRPWRGNVRELQNTINRAVLLGTGRRIEKRDLMLDVQAPCVGNDPACHPFAQLQQLDYAGAKEVVLKEFTEFYLRAAIQRSHGNISMAAKNCGMERQALQRLLRRYQISVEEFRAKKN